MVWSIISPFVYYFTNETLTDLLVRCPHNWNHRFRWGAANTVRNPVSSLRCSGVAGGE